MQQQIGRLVVSVVGAVSERELRFAEARDGVAQPVAQRLEVVLGVVIPARPGTSRRSRMPR